MAVSRADLFDLLVRLDMDQADFRRGVASVQRDVDRMGQRFEVAESKLRSFTGAFQTGFAALGGVAIGAGAIQAVEKVIELADELERLEVAATTTGAPVEQLSRLEFAAVQTRVEIDELHETLRTLSQELADLDRGGTTTATTRLAELGIALTDAEGNTRSVIAVLDDLADEVQKLPSGIDRIALVMDVLGESGARMVPFLEQGSAGLRELGDEGERLGVILGREEAAVGTAFNERMRALAEQAKNLALQFAVGLLPTLIDLIEKLDIGPTAFEAMREAGLIFGQVIAGVGETVRIVGNIFGNFVQAADLVGSALSNIVYALRTGDFEGAWNAWRDVGEQSIQQILDNFDQIGDASAALYDIVTGEGLERARARIKEIESEGEAARERALEDAIAYAKLRRDQLKEEARLAKEAEEAAKRARKASADAAREAERLTREQERQREELERMGEALRSSLRTPLEEYNESLDQFSRLLQEDAISLETFERAVDSADLALKEALGIQDAIERIDSFREQLRGAQGELDAFKRDIEIGISAGSITREEGEVLTEEKIKEIEARAKDAAETMSEGFFDAGARLGESLLTSIAQGESSFSDMVDGFIDDISRLLLSSAFQELKGVLFGTGQTGQSAGASFGESLLSGILGVFTGGVGDAVAGGLTGTTVNITNTAPATTIDSVANSSGGFDLVVRAAGDAVRSDFNNDLRRGYSGFAEPISSSYTTRRRV